MLTKKKIEQIINASGEERQALIAALSDSDKKSIDKLLANAAKMHEEGKKMAEEGASLSQEFKK